MKHLEEQIKFIDKKLLPLYGFKNIIDYTFVLCISDLDNLNFDLDKLNGLIEEFRKVFNSKNFSLHKTQYKIITKSQAICLLKTCLEINSIPFDISLKKNKKYLRLICKNNIIDNYINTLKMTENRTFNNKMEFEQKNINPDSQMFIQSLNPEGLKKYEVPKIITKEQLNNGIKKINNVNFFLSPKRLVRSENFNNSVIEIDMKKFDLDDKILKSFCVKFISKKINNQPIIAENLIEYLIKNMEFKIKIGGSYPYNWSGKFTNGSNCIIDNIILPNKCLEHHTVILHLTNIDEILYLLENLEIKVSSEYVNLYTELNNVIEKSIIEQSICMGNKHNILRIMYGMAGNAYNEFINLDRLNEIHNKHLTNDEDIYKNSIELNKNDIINELKLFIGKSLIFGDIEGFEITNYSKDFVNQNASNALNYNYNFVCWDLFYDLKTDGIEYYRIKNKNTFTHCYKINICNYNEQILHTISKLQIISNFSLNKILNTCINYCEVSGKKLDIPVKYNFDNNNMLEIDLENKHLLLYGKISDILIQFESENEEELIGNKITVVMKAFKWIKKYISLFTLNSINTIIIDPNSISL